MAVPEFSAQRSMLVVARTLALTVLVAPVLFAFALYFVVGGLLPFAGRAAVVAVVAGIVVHVVCETMLYRMPPLVPGTPPGQAATQSVARFQMGQILRFTLAEGIAVLALAFTFVLQVGLAFYLVAMLTSMVLLAVHVYPWSRPVRKSVRSLERTGAKSWLLEAWGFAGPEEKGAVVDL